MKIEMLGQSTPPQPKITAMLTILSARPGVTPEQVMKIMPDEIRATVPLYLDVCFRQGCAICSSVERILAVVAFLELALNPFRPPNLSACSFGMFPKVVISRCEVFIDGLPRGFERSVIAVVNDGSCHSTEHRFDDV